MTIKPKAIVQKAKERVNLSRENIDVFLETCFKQLVKEYEESDDLGVDSFQSMASRVGSVFEIYFETVIEELYNIEVERDVELPDACMRGTGSADAVFYSNGEMLAIIELKGNPKEYKNFEGETVHEASQAGLQRSDTAKKAVCQAYQSKSAYPDTPFFLISNVIPKDDTSSHCVLDKAEGDIIDMIVDAGDPEQIESMIEHVR